MILRPCPGVFDGAFLVGAVVWLMHDKRGLLRLFGRMALMWGCLRYEVDTLRKTRHMLLLKTKALNILCIKRFAYPNSLIITKSFGLTRALEF
ncbi:MULTISPECIES: hypothetical protein [unclassified Bartonella]|uniref:hypothetical protein n=1 Tax=unclassified Bartonella TaxID=2645622 RepID=UPI0035D0B370